MLRATLLFFVFISIIPLWANEPDMITSGERITVTSNVLGEERSIWVSHPNGYAEGTAKYPVLYLLDGPGHYQHTLGSLDFLSSRGNAPEMIIVAIANTDRTRDLTPEMKYDTTRTRGGGAANFLKFINTELKPYIKKNYRTRDFDLLIGHSFGGLFAVNTLLTEPESFDAYIAISPSLWWDNQRLVVDAERELSRDLTQGKFLYMTTGNEGPRMLEPTQRVAKSLEIYGKGQVRWAFQYMPDEDHGSIPFKTTYDGLGMLFEGWRLPREIVREGTLDQVDKHYKQLSKQFGYTIPTPEGVINGLGYRYIGSKEFKEAIRVLKRNVEKYPNSANVYDSLGDAYDANGDSKLALENYTKAWTLAKETNHPNTSIYLQNVERVKKKAGTN
ncbi:MAG: alpha/beta hydrolase-fold protein [Calditrichota bacterium]